MIQSLEAARDNRDPVSALMQSGLPNTAEDAVLDTLQEAGLNRSVNRLGVKPRGFCLPAV